MEKLNISWMYPDILNLHGDRGNIMALAKVASLLNYEPVITRVENFEQKIDFENTDILFFNVGEIKSVPSIIDALKKQEDELVSYIEERKIVFVVGATGAVFANQLKRRDGSVIKGLGLLNMDCEETDVIYGDDIHVEINKFIDDELVGSQIHMIKTKLNLAERFGTLIYGRGNNEDDFTEGAVYENLIFTNILGPVLVKNPWFAEALVKRAMENKGIYDLTELEPEFELERKSAECIKKFISKKKQG